MMRVRFVKQITAAVLALAVAAAGVLALRQIDAAIVRSSQGADPASAFHEAVKAPVELLQVMPWLPDPPRDGRPMEPGTRQSITEAYASAWSALDRASRGDPGAPIDEYLSGPAQQAAHQAMEDARRQPLSISQLQQALELTFYSDDGSVVAFNVPEAEIVRIVGIGDTAVVVPTVEFLQVVMLLEDGNWRVQQLYTASSTRSGVQTIGDTAERAAATRALADDPLFGANSVTAYGEDPTWLSYDPMTAEADLQALAPLGMDSLRVFVAGGVLTEESINNLRDFATRAADHDVRLVVTLLDGIADHSPLRWRDDYANVEQVVGALANQPAVVLWDLKNEPDLDDVRSGGRPVVDAWLREIAVRVRALDPDTPTTVGWSNGGEAARVLDAVDVVSFHHFDDAALLRERLERLRPLVGDHPVMLTEFGSTSWRGFVRGEVPGHQAADLYELLRAADEFGVSGRLVWVLRDPVAPPSVSNNPWAQQAELSYGVLWHDGRAKQATQVLVDRGQGPPPRIAFDESFRMTLPYAIVALAAFLIVFVLVMRYARVRRRRRAALAAPPDPSSAVEPPEGVAADPTLPLAGADLDADLAPAAGAAAADIDWATFDWTQFDRRDLPDDPGTSERPE